MHFMSQLEDNANIYIEKLKNQQTIDILPIPKKNQEQNLHSIKNLIVQEPSHDLNNYKQVPSHDLNNYKQIPSHNLDNYKQIPSHDLNNYKQIPSHDLNNYKKEPSYALTNAKQEKDNDDTNEKRMKQQQLKNLSFNLDDNSLNDINKLPLVIGQNQLSSFEPEPRKQFNVTSCSHLNGLINEADDDFKHFPLKFKLLCQVCVSDAPIKNPGNELMIKLVTVTDISFTYSILEQALLALWKDQNNKLLKPEDLENFQKKWHIKVDDEAKSFQYLVWLLSVLPSIMVELIPKHRLLNDINIESPLVPKHRVNKADIDKMLHSLKNFSGVYNKDDLKTNEKDIVNPSNDVTTNFQNKSNRKVKIVEV